MIGMQQLHGLAEFLFGRCAQALGGLAGQMNAIAIGPERIAQLFLGVAVARGDVKIIDALIDRPADVAVGVALTVVHGDNAAIGDCGNIKAGFAEPSVLHA